MNYPRFITQDAGDVFPYNPPRTNSVNQCQIDKREVAAWVCQSFSQSSDTERLAGGSSDKNVN